MVQAARRLRLERRRRNIVPNIRNRAKAPETVLSPMMRFLLPTAPEPADGMGGGVTVFSGPEEELDEEDMVEEDMVEEGMGEEDMVEEGMMEEEQVVGQVGLGR